jgi:hypothetical protein
LEKTASGSYSNSSLAAFNAFYLDSSAFSGTDFTFTIRGPIGYQCTIESATQVDASTWSNVGTRTLNNGTATFSYSASSSTRFFRVRSGTFRSANAVGYVKLTIPTGLSLFANQLNNGNNTVPTLFASTPLTGSVTVFKLNGSGTYDQMMYDQDLGGWNGTGFSLSPGDGAWIDNASGAVITLKLLGEVPQSHFEINVPNGISYRSSPIPQAGLVSTVLGFPLPPDSAMNISRWVNATGLWQNFSFDPDFGWSPSEPTAAVGESFWIDNPNPATPWTRDFSVWTQ